MTIFHTIAAPFQTQLKTKIMRSDIQFDKRRIAENLDMLRSCLCRVTCRNLGIKARSQSYITSSAVLQLGMQGTFKKCGAHAFRDTLRIKEGNSEATKRYFTTKITKCGRHVPHVRQPVPKILAKVLGHFVYFSSGRNIPPPPPLK